MTGAARIQMQHFQVARLAAPAAVMLAQLQSLGGPTALPLPATLLKNPALLLRALDALHRTAAFPAGTSPGARLKGLDADWLDSLVRRSALHVALQDSAPNHAFLLRQWLLTRRLSLLASAFADAGLYADTANAACCGALLRAGMLVLEQQQSDSYAELIAGDWQQHALLAAERALFQVDHAEAAVRLAESWQLDQFSVDALRYQAVPLAQILDAAPLVKTCWYANALAEGVTPQLLEAGRELLGLKAEQVQSLLDTVQQELANECAALGLAGMSGPSTELAQEAQQKLHQLRQEISTDNMLAQHAGGRADMSSELPLARVLQDAGIEPVFIVLGAGVDQVMEVRFSHRVQPHPAGLSFPCAPGRNALSTLILRGEPGVLTAETEGLTVVDRQLLMLLGGQTVLCEPLQDGNKTVVLLLGMSASAVSTYLAQHTLRRFIGRMLLTQQNANPSEVSASTVLLQQRVREAVHEANNPLAIIKNYLYVYGMKQGKGTLPDEIQLVRAEIDRVAAILVNLRQPADVAPRKVSLNKVVTVMHRMLASSFRADGKQIAVELQLAPEEPEVFASEHALKQILVNLVKNAAEALGAKGTITLGTRTRIYLHDRFFAQISVRDDGPGIPADVMYRLFKPGSSTKGGAHAGSGLGIVRRLVEEMGGQIGCRSDSKGTAMEILIPLSE